MGNADCTAFLRWALPRLGLRWEGFRRPRRQVCRRIRGRIDALQLAGFEDYRRWLQSLDGNHDEWGALDALCRVTISRFFRDRAVWETLNDPWLPALAGVAQRQGRSTLRAWSAGCASGEEPYSLRLLAQLGSLARTPVDVEIVATDANDVLLERARRALYPAGSLREVPRGWRSRAFDACGDDRLELREPHRAGVRFQQGDIRRIAPAGPLDLILCRNLAFTYFDVEGQGRFLDRLGSLLRPGGLLVVGGHESPPSRDGFEEVARSVFRATPHLAAAAESTV